jgi:hypothetical protein
VQGGLAQPCTCSPSCLHAAPTDWTRGRVDADPRCRSCAAQCLLIRLATSNATPTMMATPKRTAGPGSSTRTSCHGSPRTAPRPRSQRSASGAPPPSVWSPSGQPPGLPRGVIVVRVALAPLGGRNMTEHLLDMGTTTRPRRPVAARATHLSAHTPQGIEILVCLARNKYPQGYAGRCDRRGRGADRRVLPPALRELPGACELPNR